MKRIFYIISAIIICTIAGCHLAEPEEPEDNSVVSATTIPVGDLTWFPPDSLFDWRLKENGVLPDSLLK